jgi:hypothetical protein
MIIVKDSERVVKDRKEILLTQKTPYPTDKLRIYTEKGKIFFSCHIDDLGNTFKCDVSEFIDSLKQIGA